MRNDAWCHVYTTQLPRRVRSCAVGMVRAIYRRAACQSDINPETLHTLTRQAQVDDGIRAGTPAAPAGENRQLRKQRSVAAMCRMLGWNTSTSDAYKTPQPSNRALREGWFAGQARRVHHDDCGCGAGKV